MLNFLLVHKMRGIETSDTHHYIIFLKLRVVILVMHMPIQKNVGPSLPTEHKLTKFKANNLQIDRSRTQIGKRKITHT